MTTYKRRKNRCRIEGCKRWNYGTICSMHRERIKKTGSPGTAQAGYELPTGHYRTAHARVEARRGKANTYKCSDCGEPAQEWSYRGGSEQERTQSWKMIDGKTCEVRFSPSPEDYDPRCIPCHRKYDVNASCEFAVG